MSESMIYVLEKMCSYVNVKYEDINFNEDYWYVKYQWTKEQELDFIKWLANEVRTNNEVRKGITRLPYRPSKVRCNEFSNHFNLMFGWKTKTEEL